MGRSSGVARGATNTGNRRTVTLDPVTMDMLTALRAERPIEGPRVLSDGDRPVNPERITAWWGRARKLAGLDSRWRLHDLRHWSATLAIASGHDIRTVANRLGHANPAMTLRVYAHAPDTADEAVVVTLAQVLDAAGDGRA
jgi:integrase